MKEFLKELFEKYNIQINETQLDQFEKYYQYLVQENEKFNLTAITEMKDVAIKHFLDSVLGANEIPQNASVIDVGTGGGFPGVPLKILRPDIKITLLDSLQKRVKFLQEVVNLLDLKNVTCVHSRAEDYAKEKREKFDVALSRAVASMPTLSEYLVPFVKVGGNVIMYKSQKAEEELKEGQKAIKTFGGNVEKIIPFNLEEVESERNIVVIKKTTKTPPKYPRGKNQPKTNPII